MHDSQLECPDCGACYDVPDNYCRQCGMYLAALREAKLPVAAEPQSRALEPLRAGVPAPVKKAATALAIGAALQVGVGIAGRYLAGQAAREAARLATRPAQRPAQRPGRALRRTEDDPLADAAAVSETVVIRRVWVRRG